MKKLLHPLSILTIAALLFVLYSVWRSGYELWQFFQLELFTSRYTLEFLVLSAVIAVCSFRYRRTQHKIFSLVTFVAIAAFLAIQTTEEYPTDYKLWIYIIAPIFAWSVAFDGLLMLVLRKHQKT